ncbi:hypothetical protein DIPPA_25076 [Diplonema papillatum]|nr:hypothetical protein DIPPA_25076 [Diplonema papillatum]
MGNTARRILLSIITVVLLGFTLASNRGSSEGPVGRERSAASAASAAGEELAAPQPLVSRATKPRPPPNPRGRGAVDKEVVSPFEKEIRQKWRKSAGLYKDKSLRPELSEIVMVTVVNNAYKEMFDNWKCFAEKHGLDFMVFSFDEPALDFIGREKSVLIPGDTTETQIQLNSERFNVMGCQKLDAVIALLEAGADVIMIDADCVFKKDPVEFFEESLGYDFYYQANHPACPDVDRANMRSIDPACFLLNSGFYYVSGRKPETVELFKRARRACYESASAKNLSPTDGAGDQRALQRTLNDEIRLPTHFYGGFDSKLKIVPKTWAPAQPHNQQGAIFSSSRMCHAQPKKNLQPATLAYCVLQPSQYPAGKSKHTQDFVVYHANHLPGGIATKKSQLAKNGLWKGDSDTC